MYTLSEITANSYAEWDKAFYDAEGPVITLFTAPAWCRPCRALENHWEKVVESLDNHTVIKVDLGSSPEDTASHWATDTFGIRGVPTIYHWGTDDGSGDCTEIKERTVIKMLAEINNL